MTSGTPQRSVLVIGASQRVLDEAVVILRDLGYTAEGTSDFFSDIAERFDIPNIDLVALGHLIPPDRKAEWFATVQAGAAIRNFGIGAGQ
jgi:hypothetical protein